MLRAEREGLTPEQLIERIQASHRADSAGFLVSCDNFYTTHSPENRHFAELIYTRLAARGHIARRSIEQAFDPEKGLFLPDRYIKGGCPRCGAAEQYGDSCESCGATYTPLDLKNPVSVLSGATPVRRESEHFFFRLGDFEAMLREWTAGEGVQPEVANKLQEWFSQGLNDWDISRDAPYFGFQIPGEPGKYFYVWVDAPIGYMASFRDLCNRTGEDFDSYWAEGSSTELYHFIGKDITYFHTLFWPAMLKTAGYSLPAKVHIHGFLTVDGEKMSKSKGTFIRAATYLAHLDPSYLRYYYASKLSPRVDDLDLNLEEFVAKVNADLVGNIVNLASRTAKFAHKTGLAETYPDDGGLFAQAAADGEQIAEAYDACDYNRAMRMILSAGDRANQFIDKAAPWLLNKDPEKERQLRDVCTIGLNLFRQLAVYLAPVLPRLARQTGELLGEPITCWDQSKTPLLGREVKPFEHMLTRVKPEQVQAMVDESREELAAPVPAAKWNDSDEALNAEPLAAEISFDDFVKVDLRVARITDAKDVPEAKKLLQLTLSFGGDVTRSVFAGIKGVYEPEALVGRLVICAANLAPRKMKFGVSEGMILASGTGGQEIYLIAPDAGAKPGQRVH